MVIVNVPLPVECSIAHVFVGPAFLVLFVVVRMEKGMGFHVHHGARFAEDKEQVPFPAQSQVEQVGNIVQFQTLEVFRFDEDGDPTDDARLKVNKGLEVVGACDWADLIALHYLK